MPTTKRGQISAAAAVLMFVVAMHGTAARAQETYASINTLHFLVKYQRGVAESDVRKLVDYIQNDYSYLSGKLGIDLPRKIEVRVYESVGKFLEEANMKQDWRIAYYSHGILYVRPPRAVTPRRMLDRAISYELVLALLEQKADKGCPRWLIESFAVNHTGEMQDLTPAQNVRFTSFADLNQDIQEYDSPPQRDDVHYLLGKTMKFFLARYGEQKVFSVFRQFDGTTTVEKAFKKVFGQEYADIEKAWADYLAANTTPFR